MRVTQKDLQKIVDQLNEREGLTEGWNVVGCYTLDYAYGGVKLAKIVTTSGGQRDVSTGGYVPKKELLPFLQGMVVATRNDK